MTRKDILQRKSRTLLRALAVLAVFGAGLISAGPARADHWHHHGDWHHHGGVGFYFGLPLLVPVPFAAPVYGPGYYEPPAYYEDPPVKEEDPPERPCSDEGHWRHSDG